MISFNTPGPSIYSRGQCLLHFFNAVFTSRLWVLPRLLIRWPVDIYEKVQLPVFTPTQFLLACTEICHSGHLCQMAWRGGYG